MSKLAIKGLLAITATLWLAQPLENERSPWDDNRAEQLSDSGHDGEASRAWPGASALEADEDGVA
jgi:hypothetical protein